MNISNKNLIRIFTVGTIFLVSLWFLYLILPTLGIIAASLLITVIINPLTNRIQKIMPRKSRGLAVVSTLLLILALLILMVYIVVQPFIQQSSELVKTVNDSIETVKENPNATSTYQQAIDQLAAALNSNATDIAEKIGSQVTSLTRGVIGFFANFFFYLFAIVSLVFFMLFDSQKVINSIGNILPKKHQKLYHNLSSNLFDIVARYFGGVIITAVLAGIFGFIPLFLIGVPYAVALAVIIAIFDVIPYIGATIGGFIVVMFILLTGNVPGAIFMILYLLVYQQIENNLVTPLVQKSTVKLSALAVLVALMIGGALGGIIGTLLAIPAAAFIKATYNILKQEGYIASNE